MKGDYVVVARKLDNSEYVAYILKCIGGSRNPFDWTLFQVLDIDTGFIEIVHASKIVRSFDRYHNCELN